MTDVYHEMLMRLDDVPDKKPYDHCVKCGHTWHGLACTVKSMQYFEDAHGVRQRSVKECKCPSQFKNDPK